MDDTAIRNLMSIVALIARNLDIRPDSWREQLPSVRYTTATLEILDTVPNQARKQWQLPLVSVFQRVAFGDADNGPVQDVADWCLRQGLKLMNLYPTDAEIMALIGRNWLMRAQRALANIHRAERGSSSSSTASLPASRGHGSTTNRTFAETEQILNTADYVEARGILPPAIEYLQRAVEWARAQGNLSGQVLVTAAEANMSLGNVTSSRINDRYYRQAMAYLREASQMPGYQLPAHLAQYLDDYGSLYPAA